MQKQEIEKEHQRLLKEAQEKNIDVSSIVGGPIKRRKWDEGSDDNSSSWESAATPAPATSYDSSSATPSVSGLKSRWDVTPAQWENASTSTGSVSVAATPSGRSKRSRWDETPVASSAAPTVSTTSASSATPMVNFGATPALESFGATPSIPIPSTPTSDINNLRRWNIEIEERNRPLSDAELDNLLPPTGYKILEPPLGYKRSAQALAAASSLLATPTPVGFTPGFAMASGTTGMTEGYGIPATPSEFVDSSGNTLPFIRQEDEQFFGKLYDDIDETTLSINEIKERKFLRLILKIKNGTPSQRKTSMRHIIGKFYFKFFLFQFEI